MNNRYDQYSNTHISSKIARPVFDLYRVYRDAILGLDDAIAEIPFRNYICFRSGKAHVAGIELQKKRLKITINLSKGQLKDAKGIARDVSTVKHHSLGDYQVKAYVESDLKYILKLIKQAL